MTRHVPSSVSFLFAAVLTGSLATVPALAQTVQGTGTGEASVETPGAEGVPAPTPAGGGRSFGAVPSSQQDINSYLPSSSRPTTSGADGFDLNQRSAGDTVVLTGGEDNGTYGLEGSVDAQGMTRAGRQPVPEFHIVKKGDTLWDISGKYYDSPYAWPRVWSMNPQVENPHWIYPGDQLRTASGTPDGTIENAAGGGIGGRERIIPRGSVFLRDQGYLGDPDRDNWGELVGAREDQMLLSEGNVVYLLMKDGVDLRLGQRLTVFDDLRAPKDVEGARTPPGELVKVYGTVRVDAWDPDTQVARGVLIESLDVIERGARVGPVGRRFDVVEPEPSEVDLEAYVLSSLYPHIYMGQYQIVFLDRGSEDGLKPGVRLRAVRRGDLWRQNLEGSGRHSRLRAVMDSAEDAPAEMTPEHGDNEDFPDEVIGEVLVLRTEEYSSVALVTESARALVKGDRVVAVSGY